MHISQFRLARTGYVPISWWNNISAVDRRYRVARRFLCTLALRVLKQHNKLTLVWHSAQFAHGTNRTVFDVFKDLCKLGNGPLCKVSVARLIIDIRNLVTPFSTSVVTSYCQVLIHSDYSVRVVTLRKRLSDVGCRMSDVGLYLSGNYKWQTNSMTSEFLSVRKSMRSAAVNRFFDCW